MDQLNGAAVIVGAYEHPGRRLPGHTLAGVHRDVVVGALDDAGLSLGDVDGFFTDSTAPGLGVIDLMQYLGLQCTYSESSEMGGATYVAYVGHAAAAIAAGKCRVAVISLAGLPAQRQVVSPPDIPAPAAAFQINGYGGGYGPVADYAVLARRHMHEFGTTREQLAWVKVASSQHAVHNPNAFLQDEVTVDDVLASSRIADPLHKLDCCVVTDGGGALVLVHPDVARELGRAGATLRGHGESHKSSVAGEVDLTYSAIRRSGELAFAEAGISVDRIRYASLYDSFTITVLMALEDLGLCGRGEGGAFVEEGGLVSGSGRLAVNTDGGGLSNNHPGNRGGMTKVIEAVRQLRGEAHPAVQVPDLEWAVASGTGFRLTNNHYSSTIVLERFS
ncbi:acetyl-CoA C-acetyltransferase [Nocardioides marinisabuli]|uniref:Acetyl-CoA C-acetyltransferase n=1 Tax=Nocardioides marinisabuli TaxID=419476 RepID=A0A7Y9F1R2_9ACTN|nr:thiolase domain-containing protein [Nocardioides marinisabuli]NYD57170.1 acetyl-CoA C-acetyltransferase [Nocardioides marinisabuli]